MYRKNLTGIKDLSKETFGGAWSIHDDLIVQRKNEAIQNFIKNERSLNHDNVKNEYFQKFKDWMFSTHNIKGYQQYNEFCYTHGTTESFSQFYIRYRNAKTLRLKRGDYFYHSMMQKLWYVDNFAWLDDDEIKEGDVLIISVPFSQTGNVPEDLEEILDQCDEKSVPVMIDMAYLNISTGLEVNLDHKCIEYVTSSLSKVFPLEFNRVGIRLQKKKFEDQLYVINEDGYNYINLQNCYVAKQLMDEFPADYIYKKYLPMQQQFCEDLDLEASQCVIFGLDFKQRYPMYKRRDEDVVARLCFSRVWDGRMQA